MKTRKRDTTFYVDHTINSKRVRGSLGTTDKQVASRLKSRLELAVVEGPRSENWAHLRSSLPSSTYSRFAKAAGMTVTVPPTWGGLVPIFLKECEGRIKLVKMSRSTLDRYEHTLTQFTNYLDEGEATSLSDITPWLVDAYKIWRREHILKRPGSRNAGSLNLDVAVLRNIMGVALKRGMITKNPVTTEGVPGANPARGTEPLTGDELLRLREAAGSSKLLYLVFRHCGFRVSDVATLRWDEIDWDAKEIRKATQKRKVEVVIPMADELHKALKVANQATPFVFCADKNNCKKPTQIAYLMRLISQQAGVKNFHTHRFRATFATELLMKGFTLWETAKVLGDTVGVVETTYAHFVPAAREKLKDLIDNGKGFEQT